MLVVLLQNVLDLAEVQGFELAETALILFQDIHKLVESQSQIERGIVRESIISCLPLKKLLFRNSLQLVLRSGGVNWKGWHMLDRNFFD